MAQYRGFTMKRFGRTPTNVGVFSLTDTDLIGQNIRSHLLTSRYDRPYLPSFYSVLPDLIMEPLTEANMHLIESDFVRVIRYDPRVELINYTMVPDYDNSNVTITAELLVVETGVTFTYTDVLIFEG